MTQQFGASLTDDARVVIYNGNMFMFTIQATDVYFLSQSVTYYLQNIDGAGNPPVYH